MIAAPKPSICAKSARPRPITTTNKARLERAVVLLLAWQSVGCGAPGGVYQPTRTPKAGHLSLGATMEGSYAMGTAPNQPERGRVETLVRDVARYVPRTRPSVHYAFTDRIALGVQGNLLFSLQALGTWNPVRTRYFDASLRLGAGYEQCLVVGSRYCEQESLSDFVFHGEALGSVGFNPISWVTLQATVGPVLQRGADTRALAWLESNAFFFLTREVALGPSLLVLPRWLPDGRWNVSPAITLVGYPARSNPY